MGEKLKIIGLKMENVKRIEAVELQFDDNNKLIEITGANGQGKTSLLDGMKFLFSGAKGTDSMPIRDGAEKAMIEVELKRYAADGTVSDTGIMIQKKFNPSGPVIKIYKKDGIGNIASSQAVLDTLYDAISFDPLAFAELSKSSEGRKKQVELLKKLTGLDFSDLEKKYQIVYQERTELNRKDNEFKSIIAGQYPDEKISSEEKSAKQLIDKIQEATKNNDYIKDIDSMMTKATLEIEQYKGKIKDLQAVIKQYEEKIALTEQFYADKHKEFETLKLIDISLIQKELNDIEEDNKKIRANNSLRENCLKHKDVLEKLATKEKEIESIKAEKQNRLAEAKMPIPGMSFNNDGILINGIPFEQVNDADKLKTSVAMAMALNPVLRVILVKNGSLLDKKNYEILRQMATDNDYTIFLERVDESGTVGIVIEDGKVKTNNYL